MAVYVEKTDPVERQKRHLDHNDIAGWGSDADPARRPAFPMERTPPRLDIDLDHDIPRQHVHDEVFHSTERPGLTPVFGSTVPPSGVSGRIRRMAFRYSENDIRHWLMLLGADRVNMVEGLLDDLAHGHVPNLWKEMGLASEWRHNRAGFVRKAAVMGGIAALSVYLIRQRRRTHGR